MAKKAGSESQKTRLEQELSALLPEINEDGLVFLLRQANVIIHNQRTAKLNEEIQELDRKRGLESPAASGVRRDSFTIMIDRSESGKSYHLTVNGRKHFFDIADTRKLVALCYRPETKTAALRFLYEFFTNERDDILMEHGVKEPENQFFEVLFREVRASFSQDGIL